MSNPPPLDYLRSSPVRGQLEPYDPRTAKGWRYIQTTDTLNQLKVLLPPGTASMYEQLLKFEAFELGKKSAISWERILEIRHLKDRMIRKCQKLATSSFPRKSGHSFTFQTVAAPPDFRVKEMEKWFQEQQKRTNALLRHSHSHITGSGPCSKCAQRTNLYKGVKPPSNLTSTQHSRASQAEKPPSTSLSSKVGTKVAPLSRRSVSSPLPLPHLLRIADPETGYDVSDDPQRVISLPLKKSQAGLNPVTSSSVDGSPPNPSETLEHRPPRPRSCIKRSSTGDFIKMVSWADDRDLIDQASKYPSIAREVQNSGRKWEEIRDIYIEQMDGLEALHRQVEQCIGQLRSESEHLQRADETIRHQRETLRSVFQDFEKKQMHFQAQVQEALENADHILSLTVDKKDSDLVKFDP